MSVPTSMSFNGAAQGNKAELKQFEVTLFKRSFSKCITIENYSVSIRLH